MPQLPQLQLVFCEAARGEGQGARARSEKRAPAIAIWSYNLFKRPLRYTYWWFRNVLAPLLGRRLQHAELECSRYLDNAQAITFELFFLIEIQPAFCVCLVPAISPTTPNLFPALHFPAFPELSLIFISKCGPCRPSLSHHDKLVPRANFRARGLYATERLDNRLWIIWDGRNDLWDTKDAKGGHTRLRVPAIVLHGGAKNGYPVPCVWLDQGYLSFVALSTLINLPKWRQPLSPQKFHINSCNIPVGDLCTANWKFDEFSVPIWACNHFLANLQAAYLISSFLLLSGKFALRRKRKRKF